MRHQSHNHCGVSPNTTPQNRAVLHTPGGLLVFVTPWTTVSQAPLSMGFSQQEHWSELPFPPPGDLLDPGIKPAFLMSSALAGGFRTRELIRIQTQVYLTPT